MEQQPALPPGPEQAAEAQNIANTTSQILASVYRAYYCCSIHERCDGSCQEGAIDVLPTPLLTTPYYEVTITTEPIPPRPRDHPVAFPNIAKEYAYDPLNLARREFRLLTVKPGVFRADYVDCEVQIFSLDSPPEYAALSYCWGPDLPDRKILCSGNVFPARESLEGALKRFRSLRHGDEADAPEYLWADAVCIDQGNAEEKSSQLLLMQDIYRKAKQVYVDLGNVTPRWYPGYDLMNRVFAVAGHPAAAAALPRLDHPSNCWEAYWSVLRAPWFTRLWIIQEITLARTATILYGRFHFEWARWEKSFEALSASPSLRYHLETGTMGNGLINYWKLQDIKENYLVHVLVQQDRDEAFRARELGGHRLMQILTEGRHDALKMVQLTRDFGCSEPRDRVFALASIMNDEERGVLGSYQLSVSEIYMRFARYQVNRGKVFVVLAHAGLSVRRVRAAMPSWVPDWTAQRVGDEVPHRPLSELRPVPYSASGPGNNQITGEIKLEDDLMELRLKGYIIDTIMEPLPYPNAHGEGGNRHVNLLNFNNRIQQLVSQSSSLCSTQYHDLDDALIRTLLIDDLYTGGNAIDWSSPITNPATVYKQALETIRGRNSILPDIDHGAAITNSSVETCITQMVTACQPKAFALTKKGYMGLVPQGTAEGDVVVIFVGATVPHILRKTREGDGFLLVGETYVHGIMYGEAVRDGMLRSCEIMIV
ncbi:hypothetical protein DL768_003378 [Monosporascus sp. mg162]|nr:hypothetical protein DL768_003378 [Monosporascus sp. mg162]